MYECINECAINELLEYSLNVQELEERAEKIRKIVTMKNMTSERELKIWRIEGIKIHNHYLMYAQFNRQKCVTDHLNEATLNKLGKMLMTRR